MNEILVSVIVPCFNSTSFVRQSITSVLNQSHSYLDIIVVDDASTDNTWDIVQEFNDPRLNLVRLPTNRGVAYARNLAISRAKGAYIAFCDSDDVWFPDKIKTQLELMNRYSAGCSHCNSLVINEYGEVIGERRFPVQVNFSDMLYRNFIMMSGAVVKSELVAGIEFKQVRHEDYMYWLEVFKKSNVRAVSCSAPLLRYRVHNNNMTRNKLLSLLWHFKVQRLFGLSLSTVVILFLKNLTSRYLASPGKTSNPPEK